MARRTKSRLTVRSVTAVVLGLGVVVASAVVWRRSVGVATAKEIQRLEAERFSLRSERMSLESDWRTVTSRQHVVQEAERRLGMHVATEGETRFLTGVNHADSALKDSVRK